MIAFVDPAKTIARNSLWSLMDSLLGMGSSFACAIAVARVMGPEKLGYYSYLVWLTTAAGWFATFGIPGAIRRYAAEAIGRGQFGRARAIVQATFRIQLYVAVPAVIAGIILVLRFAAPLHRTFALLTVISILPFLLYSIPAAAISASEDLRPNVRASIVSTLITGGGTAFSLIFDWGLPGLAASMVAARTADFVLRQIFYVRIYSRFPKTDPDPDERLPPELKRQIVRFCWQASLITGLEVMVWDRSEILFLEHYSPIVQVAFYSMAFNHSQYLLMLPRVAAAAASATISVEQGRDATRTSGLAVGTMRVLALICIPAAFGMGALAGPLYRILYDTRYLDAIPVFAVISILTIGKALQLPARMLMTATERQSTVVIWAVALGAVNVALNMILIPSHGAVGAAVSKGIIQTIGCLTIWWIVAVSFRVRLPVSRLARITASGAIMFVIVRTLAAALPPPAAVVIGPVVGFAIVLVLFRLLRCLDPADRAILKAFEPRLPRRLRGIWGVVVAFLFRSPSRLE